MLNILRHKIGVNKTYSFSFCLKKTHGVCIIKKTLLMLYREITYAYCEKRDARWRSG
jgi:hypothetical protein